jgi:tetratricopeptide (TPR) repeat protein
VRAVFSWSYRRLSPAAGRLFRLLGGRVVDVHSAAALAGADVRDALAELERAQLVSEAAGRYGCHDLLSAYAAELPEPDREAALDRLLDYYLHCADIADGLMPLPRGDTDFQLRHRPTGTPPLHTPEDAMAWFDAELTNIVNAVDTAPTHAHQLAQTLSRYLWLRADWLTWLRVCEVALPSTEGLPEPRLRTLFNISAAHHRMGDFDEALRWIERALPVSTEVSANAHALALSSMGHALLEQERYDEAEQCYLEAALEADQPGTEAMIRHNLAILMGRVGRFDEAEREFSEAFPLYEKAGHHIGVIDCHCNVAEMQLSRGDLAEALDAARIALDLARAHGSRKLEATSLELIGDALGSAAHWEQALVIYEELREPEADRARAKIQADRNV